MMANNSTSSADNSETLEGSYVPTLNETINSRNDHLKVIKELGIGTFGVVLKCYSYKIKKFVALKISRKVQHCKEQGINEAVKLSALNSFNDNGINIIKIYDNFIHRDHFCIVVEFCQESLYDHIKNNKFLSMPLAHIRFIIKQALCCLVKLKQIGLIHGDLKPENIMLVDPVRQPLKIKIIDFGSSISRLMATPGLRLQSLFYRAPEIILSLPFSEAIDIWSLGCIAAELFLGRPLYPGRTENHIIRFINKTQGPLPASLNESKRIKNFHMTKEVTENYIFERLEDIGCLDLPEKTSPDSCKAIEEANKQEFIQFLQKMLDLDQKNRIGPTDAMLNNFFIFHDSINLEDWER